MNTNKILRIMPFVIGVLIVILVIILIITSGDNKPETQINPPIINDNVNTDDNTGIKEEKPGVVGVIEADPVKTDDEPEITDEPADPENTDDIEDTPARGEGNEFGLEFTDKNDFVDIKNGVNLRAGASTETSVVAYLETGKRLERTGYNDEWTRVIYDGIECYVATHLVIKSVDSMDSDNENNPDNTTAADENTEIKGEGNEFGLTFEEKSDYVDLKPGINLRVGASTDTSVAAYLEDAKRVERIGYNADWTKVKYDGRTCYVATFLVVRAVDSMDAEVVVPDENNDDQDNTDNTEDTANTGNTADAANTDNSDDVQNTEENTQTENTAEDNSAEGNVKKN